MANNVTESRKDTRLKMNEDVQRKSFPEKGETEVPTSHMSFSHIPDETNTSPHQLRESTNAISSLLHFDK